MAVILAFDTIAIATVAFGAVLAENVAARWAPFGGVQVKQGGHECQRQTHIPRNSREEAHYRHSASPRSLAQLKLAI
jgi:hypothetical protein